MRLKHLYMKNFMKVGELDLDLSNHQGRPIVVVGPNGAGKSSMFSAVQWALTGSGGRPQTRANDVKKWGSKGGVKVSTTWEHKDKIITVDRHRGSSKHKNNLYYSWNDHDISDGATSDMKVEELYSVLGISEAQVNRLMVFRQGGTGLLNMDQKDIIRLVREIMGADVYIRMGEIANEYLREKHNSIIKKESRKTVLEQKVVTDQAFDLSQDDTYHAVCSLFLYWMESSQWVEDFANSLNREDLSLIQNKIRDSDREVYQLDKSIGQSESLLQNDRCPTCSQSLQKESYRSHILKYIEGLKKQRDDLRAEESSLLIKREEYETLRNDWIAGSREGRGQVNELQYSLREEESLRRRKKGILDVKIEEIRSSLSKVEDEIREMDEDLGHLDYWKKWAKATYIKTQSIFFSSLHRHLTDTLAHFFTDKFVEVDLGFEKKADGSPRYDRMSFNLKLDGRPISAGCFSGGERARLNVALQAAMLTATPIKTILFDEWFKDLDSASLVAVWSYLQKISDTHTVLVITHKSDWVDPTFRVTEHGEVKEV